MPEPNGKKEEYVIWRISKWATRKEVPKSAKQGYGKPSTTTRESD